MKIKNHPCWFFKVILREVWIRIPKIRYFFVRFKNATKLCLQARLYLGHSDWLVVSYHTSTPIRLVEPGVETTYTFPQLPNRFRSSNPRCKRIGSAAKNWWRRANDLCLLLHPKKRCKWRSQIYKIVGTHCEKLLHLLENGWRRRSKLGNTSRMLTMRKVGSSRIFTIDVILEGDTY